MKTALVLIGKDVRIEARSLDRLATLGFFAASLLITLQFSLPPESDARPKVAAGFLWAAVLLASMLEFRRASHADRTAGTLDALRVAPIDPALLYTAKVISSALSLSALAIVLVPLTAFLFIGDMSGVPVAIGVTLLAIAGLAAWGTLFAAVAEGARAGEVILPVLLFPLVVPQTIAAVRLIAASLTGQGVGDLTTGFLVIAAFDVLSYGTSVMLFDYVLDE